MSGEIASRIASDKNTEENHSLLQEEAIEVIGLGNCDFFETFYAQRCLIGQERETQKN